MNKLFVTLMLFISSIAFSQTVENDTNTLQQQQIESQVNIKKLSDNEECPFIKQVDENGNMIDCCDICCNPACTGCLK